MNASCLQLNYLLCDDEDKKSFVTVIYLYTPLRRHHTVYLFSSHLENRGLLLTDEHTDVRVAQVSAVDLAVAASGVDVCEGLVDLQRPHALVVHAVRGDAPLLAQRPEADGPVGAARQTLGHRWQDEWA